MEPRTAIVPVLLPNGKEIRVEAALLPGEEEVAFKALPAEEIFDAVEGIAQAVVTTLQGCDRASATDYAAFPGVLSLEPS